MSLPCLWTKIVVIIIIAAAVVAARIVSMEFVRKRVVPTVEKMGGMDYHIN